MKIIGRIDHENQDLVGSLGQKKIKAEVVNDGTVIELSKVKYGTQIYSIPAEIKGIGFELLIDIAEESGEKTNSSHRHVVCKINGEKLRPYYVSSKRHASFAVPNAVVTVEGCRSEDKIIIKKHELIIIEEGTKVEIKTTLIWEGDIKNLPDTFSCYTAAAKAVVEKGNYYLPTHTLWLSVNR